MLRTLPVLPVIESWNLRKILVRRDLWRLTSPTQSRFTAWDTVQKSFLYLQQQQFHSPLGHLFDCPHGKKTCFQTPRTLPCCNWCPLPLVPSLCTSEKNPVPPALCKSTQVYMKPSSFETTLVFMIVTGTVLFSPQVLSFSYYYSKSQTYF